VVNSHGIAPIGLNIWPKAWTMMLMRLGTGPH
jgi:hypothetical protein